MQPTMDPFTTLLGLTSDLKNLPVAVTVAAIVNSLIVGVWYSIATVRKLGEMTETASEAPRRRLPRTFVGQLIVNVIAAFVVSLVAAFVLAILLGAVLMTGLTYPSGVEGGVIMGFFLWLASVVATLGSAGISEGLSGEAVGINMIFSLVSYLMLGLIVGALL